MARKQKTVATVALRTDWPGEFRRVVRDTDGNEVETLTFSPGQAMDLTEQQLAACEGSIPHALRHAETDAKGRTRFLVEPAEPGEVEKLNQHIAAQTEAIEALIEQVRSLGAEPIVTLDDDSDEDVKAGNE